MENQTNLQEKVHDIYYQVNQWSQTNNPLMGNGRRSRTSSDQTSQAWSLEENLKPDTLILDSIQFSLMDVQLDWSLQNCRDKSKIRRENQIKKPR